MYTITNLRLRRLYAVSNYSYYIDCNYLYLINK